MDVEQDHLSQNEMVESPASDTVERAAIWVQLPRRVVALILAFLGAQLLILLMRASVPINRLPGTGRAADSADIWSRSLTTGGPVWELVRERLAGSLLLLSAGITLALMLAIIPAIIGVLAHRLEKKNGWPGSALKGLGRLWMFSETTVPVAVLGVALLALFVVQLKLFRPGYIRALDGSLYLQGLVLPAFLLALYPALLIGQTFARKVTMPRGDRAWLAGLLLTLGALARQTAGLISALIIVELIFNWPGLGRLFIQAASTRDMPVLFAVLIVFSVIVLAGRMAGEVWRWLARMLAGPTVQADPPTPWQSQARRIWTAVGLVALLIPLLIGGYGLTVSADAVTNQDLAGRNAAPSGEHLFGTDQLGRDAYARTMKGASRALAQAGVVAALTIAIATVPGAVAGFLDAKRTWKMESVADALRLLFDPLLMIPVLPGVIAAGLLFSRLSVPLATLLLAVFFVPRTVRAWGPLWRAGPDDRPPIGQILLGVAALFLGLIYAAFAAVLALDFVGFNSLPPTPSLGGILVDQMRLLISASSIWGMIILTAACAVALYLAADALLGYFYTKEAMDRLYE